MLGIQKRIHFIPQADHLVTVETSLKSILLRRVDVADALLKAGIEYLLGDSLPPPSVRRGKQFVYRPKIRSKNGGVQVRLDYAPEAMTQTTPGTIEWPVTADFPDPSVKFLLHFKASAGQEAYQAFSPRVR